MRIVPPKCKFKVWENGDGIYHKKRQPREAAQRLRGGRCLRQPQAQPFRGSDRPCIRRLYRRIIRRGDMEGKLGSTLLLHNVKGTLADRVLLVGLGKERDFREREFRSAIRAAVQLLNETGSYEAV